LNKLASRKPFVDSDIKAAFAAACSAAFKVLKNSGLSMVCPSTVTVALKHGA